MLSTHCFEPLAQRVRDAAVDQTIYEIVIVTHWFPMPTRSRSQAITFGIWGQKRPALPPWCRSGRTVWMAES